MPLAVCPRYGEVAQKARPYVTVGIPSIEVELLNDAPKLQGGVVFSAFPLGPAAAAAAQPGRRLARQRGISSIRWVPGQINRAAAERQGEEGANLFEYFLLSEGSSEGST